MGYKRKDDRGKGKIKSTIRLIGTLDRRLQNRKWAKTDSMTSAFAH